MKKRKQITLSPAALVVNTDPTVTQSILYERYRPQTDKRLYSIVEKSLFPPEDILPADWAEKSIIISPRVSKRPGLITLDSYQRGPLNAIKTNEHVVCCFGAQVGKTVIVQCALGYFIDQAPGPCMVVYPTQKLCLKRSKKHLKPMIQDSPVLAAHLPGDVDDLLSFSYTMDRMDISLAWAGSPADMSSEPIQILIRDETAKFPGATSTEADAMSLTFRRTISYGDQRRVLDVTTPALPHMPGWRDLLKGTYNEFYILCPECGESQVLRWNNFRWPKRESGEGEHHWQRRVLENTTIECIGDKCAHQISNIEKNYATSRGDWSPNNPEALYESYHLPSWYSLAVKLGQVALNFIDSREDLGLMRDFTNGDCAEPWRELGSNTSVERIKAHICDYERNTIPISNEVIIMMFVDVQQSYMWYQIWAFTSSTMYSLDHGTVGDLEDITKLRAKTFMTTNKESQVVQQCFIDARYRTSEIYEYCALNQFVTPLFGCSDLNRKMSQIIAWKVITKYPGQRRSLSRAIKRMDINADNFAEQALIWFNSGFADDTTAATDYDMTESRFFLHRETDDEYCRHLTRKKKVPKVDSYGRETYSWIDVHKRHDYFDLFVYALAARYYYAEILQELKKTTKHSGKRS